MMADSRATTGRPPASAAATALPTEIAGRRPGMGCPAAVKDFT